MLSKTRATRFALLEAKQTHIEALALRSAGIALKPCEGMLVPRFETGPLHVLRCADCGDVLVVIDQLVVHVESWPEALLKAIAERLSARRVVSPSPGARDDDDDETC